MQDGRVRTRAVEVLENGHKDMPRIVTAGPQRACVSERAAQKGTCTGKKRDIIQDDRARTRAAEELQNGHNDMSACVIDNAGPGAQRRVKARVFVAFGGGL